MYLMIHHIRFCVKDCVQFSKFLTCKMGFAVCGRRLLEHGNTSPGMVLKHNNVLFIIDQQQEENDDSGMFCSGNLSQKVDTVCDVCFCCENISKFLKDRPQLTKEQVLCPLTEVSDSNGSVSYAVVKSPIGNLQHTLVDLSQFKGSFLPDFVFMEPPASKASFDCVDHIAFALKSGRSSAVLQWYHDLMGFSRLYINNEDSQEDGFVVKVGEKGMRLKAAHVALQKKLIQNGRYSSPKFVLVESLNDSADGDQIGQFLCRHLNEGVQHIAFKTADIFKSLSFLQENGLDLVTTPDSYYLNSTKKDEIEALKFNSKLLKQYNVLVESHFTSCAKDFTEEDKWFILQCFTRPVFPENTLFFEVIQRFHTPAGFGAGNITALWKAVQRDVFDGQ